MATAGHRPGDEEAAFSTLGASATVARVRDYLQEPRSRGRRIGEVISYVLATAAAGGAAVGLLVAVSAASASNRANNPFADIGVAFGWVLLIVMTLLAFLFFAVGRLFRRR